MSLADAVPFAAAAWNLDDLANGTRLGQVGSVNLADDNGNVGSVTGKFGNAADFERDSSCDLKHANTEALQAGNINFMVRCWVKLESKPSGIQQVIVSKWGDGDLEYLLDYYEVPDRFRFVINDGSSSTVVQADNFGSPSTATWYLIHAWHDSVNDLIGISVNAGEADTTSTATGIAIGTDVFRLGAKGDGGGGVSAYFDGLIDDAVVLKSYFLDATERTADYNGGTGVAFADWGGGGGISGTFGNQNGPGTITLSGSAETVNVNNGRGTVTVTGGPGTFNADNSRGKFIVA